MRFGDDFRVDMRGICCIYCGDISQSDEHFPPASVSSKGWLFSACLECNHFAKAEYPFDFYARFNYVKSSITKRYSHLNKVFDYTLEELQEFEGNLRLDCEKWSKAKQHIAKRLAWSVQDYFDLIDQSNPFVLINVDSLGIIEKESRLFKNINQKSCLECGISFVSKQSYARFCRPICSQRYKRANKLLDAKLGRL